MMDFSSLVLMERDKENNYFVKELGSYEVGDGAKYINKFYCKADEVYIFFSTIKDVKEWEYTAIFDLFNIDAFIDKGYEIEEIDDEYNPTWLIKIKYNSEHNVMKEKLNDLCDLIEENMEKVLQDIEGKEEFYV